MDLGVDVPDFGVEALDLVVEAPEVGIEAYLRLKTLILGKPSCDAIRCMCSMTRASGNPRHTPQGKQIKPLQTMAVLCASS